MDRPLQHRDINEPIERLVREHLGDLEIAAIHYGPLTRSLQDVVHDLVTRAQAEAVAGAGKRAPTVEAITDPSMQLVITVPDDMPVEVVLAVLADCVDRAAAGYVCTDRLKPDERDAHLGVAYHLRRAIRAVREGRKPAILGTLVESPTT
jgi:hypothetical protein